VAVVGVAIVLEGSCPRRRLSRGQLSWPATLRASCRPENRAFHL